MNASHDNLEHTSSAGDEMPSITNTLTGTSSASSRDDSYSNHRIAETSTVETTRIRDHTAVVFVPHFGQTKREQELQHAYVKSHAARIGHSKRRAWKSAQPQEPAAGNPQELRKSDYNILMPHPKTLLSESTTDPFNNDECRKLSSLALRSLDHTYEIVWPGNFPTIRGSALRSLIQLWKRITVQSDLAFHTHVAQAASLCYLVSTDPEVKDNLMKVRINHQYISTKLVREAIGALSEPASDDLIESILRLGANGVNIIETPIVSKYPESPVMECLRHPKLYGRFEPAMPHFSILRHLVETRGGLDGLNPATSQPLQMSVYSGANFVECILIYLVDTASPWQACTVSVLCLNPWLLTDICQTICDLTSIGRQSSFCQS
ncbi:hypothetical protein PV11_05438 [Exophiala sideris]|uniref:Uncharacterized protein n=1 Tax=Exophiala sideris TaxID=1016849 RepID=A0A0D1YKL8_9EURO|nr:hypothetical protein PV11_05438 [Exophiala sideris]